MTSTRIDGSNIESHLALVVGVDGSGKSTFLDQLSTSEGYTILEPTTTREARQFKLDSLETRIDGPFIDAREALYLGLNDEFDDTIITELGRSQRVATTGGRIVTQLSHAVMRNVAEGTDRDRTRGLVDDIVEHWLNNNHLKPDVLVLVHAPADVILGRIGLRQEQGDISEKFWGFNSPFFLCHYQDAWLELAEQIKDSTSLDCLTLNSDEMSPEEMTEKYVSNVLKV